MFIGDSLGSLGKRWRDRAKEFRRFGAESQACVFEIVASELDAAIAADANQLLSLDRASLESGYTVAHLKRMLTQGKLRSVALEGTARIRREDLPRKRADFPGNSDANNVSSMEQVARAIASGDS